VRYQLRLTKYGLNQQMSIETTIVEQMRLQEGRLFQNEQILALYLDVKAIIHDSMNNDVSQSLDHLEEGLFKLGPKGVPNYHARVLYDSVRIVAKLLWPSQMLLVAKPKVILLLKGLQERLRGMRDVYKVSDPIKQDIFMREAFRRTLINDCLYVFDESVEADKIHDEPMVDLQNVANGLDTLDTDAVGPDDSASHIGSRLDVVQERPAGAHSRLGPIEEHVEAQDSIVESHPEQVYTEHDTKSVASVHREAKSVEHVDETRSVAESLVKSVVRPNEDSKSEAKSVKHTKSVLNGDVQSVVPRMIPVSIDSERRSTVSHVSTTSTASVLRRPVHVKKIIIDTTENAL